MGPLVALPLDTSATASFGTPQALSVYVHFAEDVHQRAVLCCRAFWSIESFDNRCVPRSSAGTLDPRP